MGFFSKLLYALGVGRPLSDEERKTKECHKFCDEVEADLKKRGFGEKWKHKSDKDK